MVVTSIGRTEVSVDQWGDANLPKSSCFSRTSSWIQQVIRGCTGSTKEFGQRVSDFIRYYGEQLRGAAQGVNATRPARAQLGRDQVDAVTQFYSLKMERQMRGLFLLAAGRTLDSAFVRIGESFEKHLKRGAHGTIPLQLGNFRHTVATFNFDTVPPTIQFCPGSVTSVEPITLPELHTLRRDLLCLFGEESLSKSQAVIVSAYKEQVKIDIVARLRSGVPVDSGIMNDLNWAGYREVNRAIVELRREVGSSDPRMAQINEVDHILSRSDGMSWSKVFRFIAVHPALMQQLEGQLTSFAENRSRYSQRKVSEVVGILSAIREEGIAPNQPALDLCCGTGDMTLMMRRCGYAVTGVDISANYLRAAQIYRTLLRPNGGEIFKRGDICKDVLPEAETWIAKHPCAPGMALPDLIIERFAAGGPRQLFLLTCCANKSVGCCPDPYKQLGLTTDSKWDDACSRSSESGEVSTVQSAMREINQIRLEAINMRWGDTISARLVEIEGSEMNQMLVLTRRDPR